MSPDESALFVGNANSELRFDSGTLLSIDLAAVEALLTEWLGSGTVPADTETCINCCEADVMLSAVVCNEALVIRSAVRTGSFVTEIGVQALDEDTTRLFLPVRGDPSVTWVDYLLGAGTFACGGTDSFPRCDEDHKLTEFGSGTNVSGTTLEDVGREPFSIHIDSDREFGVVTDLSSGAISLVHAPRDGVPSLVDVIEDRFRDDGTRGVVGVAGRLPGDRVYVTSRVESRVQMFAVTQQGDALIPLDYFFLNRIAPGDDMRDIVFRPDGDEAYVISRDPPIVEILDTSLNAQGVPRNVLGGAIEICDQAAGLIAADVGEGIRLYVSCFGAGQVWVLNPERQELESVIDVGRGPRALAVSVATQRLFVANVLEDTIATVDLVPGSATKNRVVLRIGRTRQSGGD